jgi:general L-amino acid transport system substrate-binding protein
VAVGATLQTIKSRGQLICGSNDQVAGFGSVDASGQTVGFDIDFCKALAAAIFGDATKVQYRPLTAQERFTAVQSGEVDVLIRNTTATLTRETTNGMDFAPPNFYDGQGIMVRTSENITGLEQLNGATICVQSGTTTELNLADAFRALNLEFTPAVFEDANGTFGAYDAGQCDAVTTDKSGLASRRLSLQAPDDHVILDVTLSKEPLAPGVLQGDPQWRDIVTWVVYGLMNAEEYDVTQANVQSLLTSEDPNIRRLLGVEGDLGTALGLETDFMVDVITAVGNYGEIYNRHLGPDTPINIPRGPNAQYTDGGLIYGLPFR